MRRRPRLFSRLRLHASHRRGAVTKPTPEQWVADRMQRFYRVPEVTVAELNTLTNPVNWPALQDRLPMVASVARSYVLAQQAIDGTFRGDARQHAHQLLAQQVRPYLFRARDMIHFAVTRADSIRPNVAGMPVELRMAALIIRQWLMAAGGFVDVLTALIGDADRILGMGQPAVDVDGEEDGEEYGAVTDSGHSGCAIS